MYCVSAVPDAVRAFHLCKSSSPNLDLFAMGRLQTLDVGDLNRLGAWKEKLDKCVYAWYHLIQDEISVVEEEK